MKFRVRLILCALAFALVISFKQALPQGQAKIKSILFGRGDDPVTQACAALRESLGRGEELKKCVYAFCNELNEKD